MKILLIGATGYVGKSILQEALQRGHQVTALVRDPSKLVPQENFTIIKGDLFDKPLLLQEYDAVIGAFNGFHAGISDEEAHEKQLQATRLLIDAAKTANIRLLMVGGAGSLEISQGQLLVNTTEFPKEWKQMALAMVEVLTILRQQHSLNWTLLSPAAQLVPGERTGQFRLGGDQLLVDDNVVSKISIEDYAMAMINELEAPKYLCKRFTVAY